MHCSYWQPNGEPSKLDRFVLRLRTRCSPCPALQFATQSPLEQPNIVLGPHARLKRPAHLPRFVLRLLGGLRRSGSRRSHARFLPCEGGCRWASWAIPNNSARGQLSGWMISISTKVYPRTCESPPDYPWQAQGRVRSSPNRAFYRRSLRAG
jgi:hypothetical protein